MRDRTVRQRPIVATSSAGQGATFTVTLPVTQAATGYMA
jgi:signal transduction histidine kinase